MSATMARQGGQVQLEQSDLRLALNTAEMAKGGFSPAAIEESQHPIKKHRAEFQETKKWGVELSGHRKVKAAIEQHPALFDENPTDGCLRCQNGTAKNPPTCWRRKGMGAPPQVRYKQPTPELTPPPPRTPPAAPSDNNGARCSQLQICLPDMHLNILLFPAPNFSIMMHMPRIVSTVKISFQICDLTKEHALVNTPSAAW